MVRRESIDTEETVMCEKCRQGDSYLEQIFSQGPLGERAGNRSWGI